MTITSVRVSVLAAILFALSFALLPLSFAKADSGNLFTNPSFEQGSLPAPTGWQSNASPDATAAAATFSTSTPGHSGNSAAQVTVGAGYTSGDAKWITTVAVEPGKYYTFSDWYKSTAITSVFVYYTGTCGDGVSNAAAGCWIGDAATSSVDWNYFSQGFLVPTGVTSVTFAHVISRPGTLTTDDYSLVRSDATPFFTNGMVTLTFDDGWQSFADNATSTLIAHGLKATQYIVSTEALTYNTNCSNQSYALYPDCYMSTTTIRALQALGFDIAAHSRTHADLVHDPIVLTNEINGSKSDIATLLGPGAAAANPVDSFAYPFGQYNMTVKQAVRDAGFLAARSVDQGFNLTHTDRYALKMQQVRDTTTAAEINALIDKAVNEKTWLILMFHHVRAGNEASGSLNSQCVVIEDESGNQLPTPYTIRDVDCTTTKVLDDIATHLASKPAGTVKTMHEVLPGWADTTAPIVVLNGSLSIKIPAGSTFVDPGVLRVTDNKDVTLPNPVGVVALFNGAATTTTSIKTNISGTWTLKYSATDAAGNVGSTTRAVIVGANNPPVVVNIATTTVQGVPALITLTGTDVDGQTLTFSTSSSPKFGVLSGTGANLVYTPQASTTAFTDSFTFKANDGIVNSNVATATITVNLAPDITAPQISDITILDVTTSGFTIKWTTNEAANSQVVYGTDANYGATTTLDTAMVTTHTVVLSGLTANTAYHFKILSTDASNNTGSSTDQTATTNTAQQQSNGGGCSGCGCGGCGGGGGGGGVVLGLIGTTTAPGKVLGASTGLTEAQINAILDLLRSFNADQSVIDNVSKSLHGLGGSTGSTDKYVFTKTLVLGSVNQDVLELQKVLKAEGFLKITTPTTYFGSLTQAALKLYQAKYGIQQTGTVGPLTRAQLNK
jgi:peptidoglycan/xylan/chitin deacetylase (PgdA/CDA1 family)